MDKEYELWESLKSVVFAHKDSKPLVREWMSKLRTSLVVREDKV